MGHFKLGNEFTTKLKVYHLYLFITHDAFHIADPRSAQDACDIVKPTVYGLACLAQWLEHRTRRCTEDHGFEFLSQTWIFFFVPNS